MRHAILIVMLWGATAWAGGTGGRMGGGNWSTPSRSSSSSSSSGHSSSWSSGGGWSHSSSSSSSSSSWSHPSTPSYPSYSSTHPSTTTYSSSDPSSSSGGPYSPPDYSDSYGSSSGGFWTPGSILIAVLVVVMFAGIAFAIMRSESSTVSFPSWSDEGGAAYSTGDVDVTVLRIAVDGRARKFVQSELARIAGIADTSTDEGRATMLREVAMLLRRLRDAWIYGGAVNEPMQALGAAKQTFDKLVDDARARFQHETITNEQGQKTTAGAPSFTPRADEGAGVILVSIIVAARIELFNVNRIGDGEDLRKALDSTGHLDAQQLVAVEVVWEPSEDDDRLSSMELEAKYPRPDLIPITGALAGKVFCTYCGGPFPGELVTCPHCGAPAPGRETAPAPQHAA